jgi:sugar phosphate isomerase/epimerase
MRCNRRQFSAGLTAALVAPAMPMRAMEIRGVELGLQTYTFHQLHAGGLAAVDTMIAAMHTLNVNLCELWSPQIEPFPLPFGYWGRFSPGATPPEKPSFEAVTQQREALRAWRVNPPEGQLEAIRKKFKDGGIRVFAYNYSFQPSMTDAEINAGFLHAKALGLDLITASSKVSMAKRVVPFAAKNNVRVAFHGHASKDPDEVSSPESFAAVLAMSPLYRINLDVAHFASAGYDAVTFLNANHDKITNLHLHDRKINDGASVPFGEGVAPARQVLLLDRDKGWKIPVFYELEYVGGDGRNVIAETARELAYERKILES